VHLLDGCDIVHFIDCSKYLATESPTSTNNLYCFTYEMSNEIRTGRHRRSVCENVRDRYTDGTGVCDT
jgi:hypothetical protein